MGILAKTLSPQSSYAAKKTNLWDELTDALEACLLPHQVDEFEEHVAALELSIPTGWREPLEELIEKRREAIAEEDVSAIVRSRFDFT
jgi:hypothetical protein